MNSVYKNRIFKNFNEFLSDIPNNTDRKNMKKELTPLIKELQKNKIDLPIDFVEIMMRFNITRKVITEFIRELIDIKTSLVSLSNRVLNQSNSFEKNTILTFHSLFTPNEMMTSFKEFVSHKYPCFTNRENLFDKINEEIDKIHGKTSKTNDQSDSDDLSNISDQQDSEPILLFEIQEDQETDFFINNLDWSIQETYDFNEEIFGSYTNEYI